MTVRKITTKRGSGWGVPTKAEAYHEEAPEIFPADTRITGECAEALRPFSVSYGPDDNIEVLLRDPNNANKRVFAKIPYKILTEMVHCFDFDVKYSRRGAPKLSNPAVRRDYNACKD